MIETKLPKKFKRGDKIQVWWLVGGGGGHELHVEECEIKVKVYWDQEKEDRR